MGFFEHDDTYEAYEQFQNTPRHEAKFSHELIAGAASFAAMRSYEQHQAQNGKPQSFGFAKELIAGFAGAEVDKLIETKGLDEVDTLRAKHEAREAAAHALSQSREFGEPGYQRQEYQTQNQSGGYGGGNYTEGGYNGGGPGNQWNGAGGNPYGGYEGQGQGYGGPAQGGYGGYGQQGDWGQQQGGYGGGGGGGFQGREQGGEYQGEYQGQGQGQGGFEGEGRHHHHHREERREGW